LNDWPHDAPDNVEDDHVDHPDKSDRKLKDHPWNVKEPQE